MLEPPVTSWHCINCGATWGGSIEIYSHGVCIHCLAEWINMKKREKGLKECFGQYGQFMDVSCGECSVRKYCIEYIGEFYNVSL